MLYFPISTLSRGNNTDGNYCMYALKADLDILHVTYGLLEFKRSVGLGIEQVDIYIKSGIDISYLVVCWNIEWNQ